MTITCMQTGSLYHQD